MFKVVSHAELQLERFVFKMKDNIKADL